MNITLIKKKTKLTMNTCHDNCKLTLEPDIECLSEAAKNIGTLFSPKFVVQ